MAEVTIINKFGRIVGWNNVKLNLFGRDIEGIVELEYNDESEGENEYGAGGNVLGQSEGNLKPMFSMSLYSEEVDAVLDSMPPGTRIHQIPPSPVTISYERNLVPRKDVVQNMTIRGFGKSVKQGDGKIIHKCKCLCSHIDWNVK